MKEQQKEKNNWQWFPDSDYRLSGEETGFLTTSTETIPLLVAVNYRNGEIKLFSKIAVTKIGKENIKL